MNADDLFIFWFLSALAVATGYSIVAAIRDSRARLAAQRRLADLAEQAAADTVARLADVDRTLPRLLTCDHCHRSFETEGAVEVHDADTGSAWWVHATCLPAVLADDDHGQGAA